MRALCLPCSITERLRAARRAVADHPQPFGRFGLVKSLPWVDARGSDGPSQGRFRHGPQKKPAGEIPAGGVETECVGFGQLLLLLLLLLILLCQIRFGRIGHNAGTWPLVASQERHKGRDFKRHFLAR
jgi:hypothetical protein